MTDLTTAAEVRQQGKTNVTFKEILEALQRSDEQITAECFRLIQTHAIVLPPEPSFILGPLGPGR